MESALKMKCNRINALGDEPGRAIARGRQFLPSAAARLAGLRG
jgi:hypothetical protein